jgi:hypothetical protein
MDKYQSTDPFYDLWQIWINSLGTRLEIRQKYNTQDSKIKGIGILQTYERILGAWLPVKPNM